MLVTFKVPAIDVLPVVSATVNLLVSHAIPPLAFKAPENVAVSDTLSTSKSVWPSTSNAPLASIFPWNVETPTVIKSPTWLKLAPIPVKYAPASAGPILIPFLAVIIPRDSTFVTSWYCIVPPIDILFATVKLPPMVTLLLALS